MKRAVATILLDLRLQHRNGFYIATAVILIPAVIVLNLLGTDVRMFILPVVLLEVAAINGFFFTAGLWFFEQAEGSGVARSVTPLRRSEYLTGKLLTLTSLTLVEGILLVGLSHGWGTELIGIGVALILSTMLLVLFAVILVAGYTSVSEFLMPAVFYTLLLLLPIIHYFGVGPRWLMTVHPLQGSMDMLAGEFGPAPSSMIPGLPITLLWLGVAWTLALRRNPAGPGAQYA